MAEHRYVLHQVKKYYSFITLTILMHINGAQAETALGQGIYYDNQQISKLAQTYPSRVSKDAGYPLINDYSTLKNSLEVVNLGWPINLQPLGYGGLLYFLLINLQDNLKIVIFYHHYL